MAGEALVKELTLDIAPALSALEPLGAAFEDIISGFTSSLGEGISSALGNLSGLDTSALTASVEGALTDATATPLPIEADTTSLDASLADVLDAPREIPVDGDVSALGTSLSDVLDQQHDVPLNADTSGLVTSIDDATGAIQDVPLDADASGLSTAITDVTSEPQTIQVEADTQSAQQALGALEGESVTVEVDADVAGAQEQIAALGTSAAGTSSDLLELGGAVGGLEIASGLARGETAGLTSGIAGLSAGAATGVGILAAFGAVIGEATSLAADAEAQNKRFAQTFGILAERVKEIDVGGLNTDLETLGKDSGTTAANLEAVASRIGLLGQSAGASDDTIVSTTQNLLALGATISVNNPRLGDAAAVTDRLTNAFARGGRALAPFGIALSSAQINAAALNETGKQSAADLTLFEKAAAGANLALGQFGDTLGDKFKTGAQNAQVQFRALKVQLEETLVAVGGPLLEPLVTSFQAALPVAQELGIALGNLAGAVLPLVADLAPALAPVAAILGDVGTGITVVSDAIHGISPPTLIGIAVGLGAIAVESGLAATAVFELGLAVDAALGPVGILVGGLALVGLAFNHFHTDSEAVKVDASEISTALLDSSDAADVLAGKSTKLGDELDKQFQKLLDAGKAGKTAADGATSLGLGYSDLTKILLGTDNAFTDFTLNTFKLKGVSEEQQQAQVALVETLRQTRNEIQANATASLQAAVQSGALTQAQIDQTAVSLGVSEAGAGIVTVYEKLKPAIDNYALAQQRANLSTAQQSGDLRDAIVAFNPAKDAVSGYTDSLVAMGVAQGDADQLAKDQTAAFAAQTDKTILASSAVTELNLAFVRGQIGASQLEGGVFALGTSLAGAQGDVSGLQKGIDSFASTATGALPDVGSAVSDFASGITKAFQDVASAANKSPQEVADAQAKLRAALNPDAFIDDLGREAAAIASFQTNLSKLVSEGLGQLAGEIAAKGPEIGGQLAATFANDHAKAVAAEGAVELVGAATSSFNTFATGPEAATAMGAGGTALANAANAGYAGSFAIEHPTQAQIDAARVIVEAASPGLSGVAAGLARAGVVAFEGEFGRLPTIAEVQSGAAQTALDNSKGPLGGAAKGAGEAATDAFGKALDPAGKTTEAITASQGIWSGQVTIDTASQARSGGVEVGSGFSLGISAGIRSDGSLAHIRSAADAAVAAAVTEANTKLGIKSPSTVGIEIGGQFVEGIALGLGDTGPITDAGALVAQAAADATTSAIDSLTSGFASKPVTIPVDADTRPATSAVNDVIAKAAKGIKVPFTPDTISLRAGLDALADTAPPIPLVPVVNTTIAREAIDRLTADMKARRIELTATIAAPLPVSALAPLNVGDTTQIDAAVARLHQLEDAEARQKQAAADFAATQQALTSFVSSAVSQLPTASAAISTFGTNVKAAIADVAKAEETASKARIKLQADESKFQGAVILAQNKRDADIAHGASQRQIFLDQAAVDKAQHDLTVATLLDTKGIEDANKSLASSQAALAKASSPEDFIRTIQGNTKNAAQFEDDLRKLVAEKFPLLAQELAKAGPDTARKLADALAGSPAKAKLAEAALEQAQGFSDQFSDFLTGAFAPSNSAALTAVGAKAGQAIGKGAVDSLTAEGDKLFTSLTDPFKGQALTIPVKLDKPQLAVTPAGPLAIQTPTHADSFGTGGITTLEIELTTLAPDGTVVVKRASVPVTRTSATKATARADMTGRARA